MSPVGPTCGGPDRIHVCALCGRPPGEGCPKPEDRFLLDESELQRRLREEYERGYQEGRAAK